MRYVDIYHNDSLVVSDCIQTGCPELTRTPVSRSFTMADGSLCMYTAGKDTAAFTLYLECSAQDARKIADSARLGCLTFAGMSYGINRRSDPGTTAGNLPEQSGVVGYITGAVQIQEISAKADIYTVKIPLQLQVNMSGAVEAVSVPAVKVFSLVIGGHGESLTDASYRYYPGGTFIRKRIISWEKSEIDVSCFSGVPDGEELLSVIERENGGVLLSGDAFLNGSLPLEEGNNTFLLTVRKKDNTTAKAQSVRFSIFRTVPEPELPDGYERLLAIECKGKDGNAFGKRIPHINTNVLQKSTLKIVMDFMLFDISNT